MPSLFIVVESFVHLKTAREEAVYTALLFEGEF